MHFILLRLSSCFLSWKVISGLQKEDVEDIKITKMGSFKQYQKCCLKGFDLLKKCVKSKGTIWEKTNF